MPESASVDILIYSIQEDSNGLWKELNNWRRWKWRFFGVCHQKLSKHLNHWTHRVHILLCDWTSSTFGIRENIIFQSANTEQSLGFAHLLKISFISSNLVVASLMLMNSCHLLFEFVSLYKKNKIFIINFLSVRIKDDVSACALCRGAKELSLPPISCLG